MSARVRIVASLLSVLTVVGSLLVAGSAPASASAKSPYRVTARLSAPTLVLGERVVVSGRVMPKATGKVTLQRRVGTTWRTVATKKLTKSSRFSFSWKPRAAGTARLRVLKASSRSHRAGASTGRPVKVLRWTTPKLSYGTKVSAGDSHTCAVRSGIVRCWGQKVWGRLGDGTYSTQPGWSPPTTVVGITNATSVTSGEHHSCARLSTGEVTCWGHNRNGELGNGTQVHSGTPVKVVGVTDAVSVSTGTGNGASHTCALLRAGTVACWGNYLAPDSVDGEDLSATAVPGITTARSLSVSDEHACVTLTSGRVQCWGNNAYGRLGTGTVLNYATPVNVRGITTATGVDTGKWHTCARLLSGQVRCWGLNGNGELGDNSTARLSRVPVTVTGITNATAVTAGWGSSCARRATGRLSCWGDNSKGQLGSSRRGAFAKAHVPEAVSGIATATTVTSGTSHACALLTSNAIRCWGYNSEMQLGDGTLINRDEPVAVVGLD